MLGMHWQMRAMRRLPHQEGGEAVMSAQAGLPDGVRRCCSCKEVKPLEKFGRDRTQSTGRGYRCNACAYATKAKRLRAVWNERARERIAKNPGPTREINRKAVRAYVERYPIKAEARAEVFRAKQRGELVPAPCEVCGKEKTHAHHDDYAKPLQVRWLCHLHHKAWHKEHGPGKNGGTL